MTLAAVDRLVHHATILELNVESYRRRTAVERKGGQAARQPARQSKQALDRRATTIKKGLAISSRHDKHARAATPKSSS